MASWAKPGVKCVCVNNAPRALLHEDGVRRVRPDWVPPVVGQVYTVESVRSFGCGVGVYLAEVDSGVISAIGSLPYDINRFRPLVTQSDDVAKFTHLLNPTKLPERV